jgi:hypothetical protein
MDALRVPARAALSAFLALAVLTGLGVDVVMRRIRGRGARAALTGIIAALTLAEVWRAPLYAHRIDWANEAAGAYAFLAAQPGDFAVVELPIGNPERDGRYMVLSAHHWKRLVNGRSGFGLTGPYFRHTLFAFPTAASVGLLRRLRVRYVLIHDAWMPRPRCEPIVSARLPELALRWRDATACLFEIVGGPPPPAEAPGREIPRAALTLRTSDGSDASAAADGQPTTHWVQPVDGAHAGWLEIELPQTRALTGLTMRLGPHYGDLLRVGRVDGSVDGSTWEPLVPARLLEPPLVDLAQRPDDLRVDVPLPGRPVRWLRLVRPGRTPEWPDTFADWTRWGVHDIVLYEAIAAP